MKINVTLQRIMLSTLMAFTLGCGGGSSAEQTNTSTAPTGENSQPVTPIDTTIPTPPPSPPPEQPITQEDLTFSNAEKTSRFLQQSTFGATANDIATLTNTSASKWFKSQLAESPSNVLPIVVSYAPPDTQNDDEFDLFLIESTTFGFWMNSIAGADQLRQRMAFALSEILVVSNKGGETLTDQPTAVASYQDILINNAFGNYRTLLEEVTYSPAMGHYLTYLGNQKSDPATGRVPDENYARELLQLFTLGVVELNTDGSIKTDNDGIASELYSNKDITGLAKVMTGLDYNEPDDETIANNVFTRPMAINPEAHSDDEKSFLGLTIPAGVDGKTSISMALDHIFAHPNLPPFITKQLIQRLVSSNPSSAYVTRTVSAFKEGLYTLPDGTAVGTGQRGDLSATLAAILFDEEARNIASNTGGKIREPILRFTHWTRAFNVQNITPQFQTILWDTSPANLLAQHPYRSPSVFNFFRPGYAAPGTTSASNGLVAPELQIINATSIPGYVNFMTHFISSEQQYANADDLNDEFDNPRIPVSLEDYQKSFLATYDEELKLANDIDALIARLNLLLTANQLSQASKASIKKILNNIPADEENGYLTRVQLAVLLVMTTPDYIVQK
ncbi:DUF1800 domain-containing protein [Pseudoalteromonas citrea]|uniref:DUF1800 domain-containing protein n=1 Tax=Pseudoalteromonas citrea TaxID=43655 RepID=A0A5S3XIS6_9GAMM|nr:DUF1800 family protein [Pseudoalteromonas citrea]TMP40452.1 DUF1800 domain-containing protein [Pseudoalteromonas citrea]TMP53915.1 DUF1800 domain-containing protein [Pseudoalteromonas citrea]